MSEKRSFIAIAGAIGTISFFLLYRKYKSGYISVADIPGPKSPSFLVGHLGEIFRTQAGEVDFKWIAEFGNVVRFKAPFGEDRLLISDPRAIQHVLQGYRWGQPTEFRASSLFVAGPSILYVEGDDHKRHRRIMNPAFGAPEAKALVPVFAEVASLLTNKWKDLISISKDEVEVLDITKWASRATLDAIGHAGFDYHFGAMENQDNKLAKVYNNLFSDMFTSPSDQALIRGHLASFIPLKWMSRLLERLSHSDPRLARGRESREVAREVARELVEEKSRLLSDGESTRPGRDVMSLLVKANTASQSERNKLSDEELYAQMLVMFIAGHETTATSLSWTLLELARNPQMQDKLRREIRDKERQVRSTGTKSEFTAEDLDSMPYLNAVLKESMRYHPVAIRLPKMALKDDCIPLSESVKTTSGKLVNEIPVRKGQTVLISIAAYNRSKEIFGEDADIFRPERWLRKDETKGGTTATSVGVFANLLTFSGGIRSCIGWRFAVLELQTFLVELIGNFEFSLTPECGKIRREASAIMVPTIEGEVEKGGQCPLRVRCVRE